MKGIKVIKLINDNQLEIIAGLDGIHELVTETMISRLGIELAGYMDFYDSKRVVLMGSKEASFFNSFAEKVQEERLRKILSFKPPAIVFSKNVEISSLFIRLGNEYKVPILRSDLKTTAINSKLYNYLQEHLSLRQSIHGTLLDINGMGTLIIGESGIGKSETALELIKKGHMLISDDRVDIFQKMLDF